jgi:hypothetical protein
MLAHEGHWARGREGAAAKIVNKLPRKGRSQDAEWLTEGQTSQISLENSHSQKIKIKSARTSSRNSEEQHISVGTGHPSRSSHRQAIRIK